MYSNWRIRNPAILNRGLWDHSPVLRTRRWHEHKKEFLAFISASLYKNPMLSEYFNTCPGKWAEIKHSWDPIYLEILQTSKSLLSSCLSVQGCWYYQWTHVHSQQSGGPLNAQSWSCSKHSSSSAEDMWVRLQLECFDSCQLMTVLFMYITFFLTTFPFTLWKFFTLYRSTVVPVQQVRFYMSLKMRFTITLATNTERLSTH